MPAKPSALLISPEAPYPMWGGGALRTASLLNYLAGRYSLDVVLFSDQPEWDPSAALPPGLARRTHVVKLPVHSRSTAARVWRNARRLVQNIPPLVDRFAGFEPQMEPFLREKYYDVAVIEHFWCFPYQPLLRRHANRIVMDLHNIESQLHRRYGEAEGGLASVAHARFAAAYEALEGEWLPRFDQLLVTSQQDLRWPGAIVYPNALPLTPLPQRTEQARIVFTGNLQYHPNIQAVKWFASEIWPKLATRHSRLEWHLVGKNEHAVREIVSGLPRVHLTGMVEDALAELSRALVAVVPLQSGSGTRLKILEAWAAGTPVVSTPMGAEGLGDPASLPLLIASDPVEFLHALERLLESPDLRCSFSSRARALYEQSFTWVSAWKQLEIHGI